MKKQLSDEQLDQMMRIIMDDAARRAEFDR